VRFLDAVKSGAIDTLRRFKVADVPAAQERDYHGVIKSVGMEA
jgi:hypothetical protein